jgi:hypothetical protein
MRSHRLPAAAAVLALALSPVALAAAPTPSDVARDYVRANRHLFGLTGSDVKDMTVSSEVRSDHNGVTHVYLQQTFREIPVHAGILNVNVAADGSVLGAESRFVANLASAVAGQNARKAAVEAAHAAASSVGLRPTSEIRVPAAANAVAYFQFH